MSRKDDLEKNIRASYQLIHEYEVIRQDTDNPKEKRRAERTIEEQWELIKGYLSEYVPLCERFGIELPQDVSEITAVGFPLPSSSSKVAGASSHISHQSGQTVKATNPVDAYALLVGVGDYTHTRFANLPATIRDAQTLAAVLTDQNRCGYPPANVEVIIGEHAVALNICTALQNLAQKANTQSAVFIYFSGHGGRALENGIWRTYLCPRETDPDNLANTAISGDEFSSLLAAIPAKKMLVILDACHAGSSADLKAAGGTTVWKSGLPDNYYEALSQGSGRVVIASSKEDQFSYVRSEGDLSLFTWYLREALNGQAGVRGDGLIHVLDVFHYVNEKVQADKPIQVPILKVKDLDLNFPIALDRGGKGVGGSAAIRATPVADIREQIVRDPIGGAKALSNYLKTQPKWISKRDEIDLKRADLERIQHDLDLFGPNDNDRAAKNRTVYFLLRVCLELE